MLKFKEKFNRVRVSLNVSVNAAQENLTRGLALLGLDPSRTTLIRRRFVAEMKARFKKLSQAVQDLVVTDDAFGLDPTPILVTMQARQAWRFQADANKVASYRKWLQQQIDEKILTVSGVDGKPWTATYVESSYKKGVGRAYSDTRKFDIYEGTQEQFLRDAFSAPEMLSKIELVSTRAFTQLQGVTDAMSQQMSRILSDGLAAGRGPAEIARELRDNVKGISKRRAEVLARTEVIHAHAEGQLDGFERLGVEEVGIEAELSTAGDDLVCERCFSAEADGPYPVKEARGMIPVHPNCRCAWVPVTEKKKIRRERAPLEELPVEERLLKIKNSFIRTVDDDYTKLFDTEFVRLNAAFPKVAKRLKNIQTLKHKKYVQRFGKNFLANAGRETDKNWRIFFDGRYFGKDAKYDLKAALKGYKKRKILTSNEIQHTLTHEYGHLVHRTLSKSQQKKIHDLWWDEFIDKGAIKIEKQISKYAATSSAEMFAESFVQHQAGKMSAWAKKVMKIAKMPKVKVIKITKVTEVVRPVLRPKMKAHAKNVYNKLQQKVWEKGLTPKEKKLMRRWVMGTDWYRDLRYAIKGKSPGAYADVIHPMSVIERKKAAAIWKTIIDKSPMYEGKTYRALGFGSKATVKKKFRVGKKIEFNFTQSASRSEKVAWTFLDNADDMNELGAMLRIKSKTGTYLGDFSMKDPSLGMRQEEVLLHFGTKYKVTASKFVKDKDLLKGGYYIIDLAEII